ncbi:glycosyltransferase family 2 protein [Luteococcus sp.]|uniref:glycosyltransferase family 2 protein n=1 Tax=Luteococcus sp. TaxID=1969402 RepID=UPI0037351E06
MSYVKIAVVIPTVQRPDALDRCLTALEGQSFPAWQILVCPPREVLQDPGLRISHPAATFVPSPKGAAAQRNAGLRMVDPEVDVVVFLDDDSVPRDDHLEEVARIFDEVPGVIAISGKVARDGAAEHVELSPEEIREALESSRDPETPLAGGDVDELYGCNIAVRRSALVEVAPDGRVFDECLPLYSAFEDLDLARRLVAMGSGRILYAPRCVVVHQGHQSGGRTQHVRYGYSSVMNLEYLRRKGSLGFNDVLPRIARSVAANSVKAVRGADTVGRRSRLRGQFLAFADLLRGRVTPERITELGD